MTLIRDILKGLNLKPAEQPGVSTQIAILNTTETSKVGTASVGPTIRCLRCATNVPLAQFHAVQQTCVRSKCFMKKDDAREAAAELLNIDADDMIPVFGGKLAVYDEYGTAASHIPTGVVD